MKSRLELLNAFLNLSYFSKRRPTITDHISESQDGNGDLGSDGYSGREQQSITPGFGTLPACTRLPSLPKLTFRNLYSRNVNQFVSIFSATDSVLQGRQRAKPSAGGIKEL